MTESSDYPINGAELSRRLLGRELVPPGDGSGGDYTFVQGEVRRLLQELGCPRAGGSHRPRYLVDEEMARRVASLLGRQLW
jgi:hypothetical protein